MAAVHTCNSDERALVGAALFDGSLFRDASKVVSHKHYANHKYRVVWWAMEQLDTAGLLPDGRDPMPAHEVARFLGETHLELYFGNNWRRECESSDDSLLAYVGGYTTLLEAAQLGTRGVVKDSSLNVSRLYRERQAYELLRKAHEKSKTAGSSPIGLSMALYDAVKELEVSDLQTASQILDSDEEDSSVVGDWGIERMNINAPLTESRVYGILAFPGGGKTSLGVQIAAKTAESGVKSSFLSLEMPKREIANLAYKHASRVAMDLIEIDECRLDPDGLGQKIRQHALGGSKLIVIDYMQYLTIEHGSTEYAPMTKASHIVRDAAKRENVAIVMLLQPKKVDAMRNGQEVDDACRKPTKGAIKGTAAFEHDSQVLIGIWRKSPGEESVADIELLIMKNRYGRQGKISCKFNGPQQKFWDPQDGDLIHTQPIDTERRHDMLDKPPSDDENLFF